jgi:dihydroxyacid dehydratase/phosphogluconate dehydratase
MNARINLNDRLPARHVTEGFGPARRSGSCDPAWGRSAAPIDQASVGIAQGGAFDLFDVGEVFKRTPYIADLKPAGRFVAKDLAEAGSIPLVMKTLLENGFLHGECLTATGCIVTEKVHRMAWHLNHDGDRAVSRPVGLRSIDRVGAGKVAFDAECGRLDARLSDTEFEERQVGRRPAFGSGYLERFSRQVGAAHHSAVVRPGGSAEKTCYADI